MSNTSSPAALVRRWLPDVLLAVAAVAFVVFGAQFTTNGNFWLDEFFSIEMVKMDWTAIPAATAADVHPPLYYFILKLFVTVFGNAHIVYRIASFVPYVLTVGMALVLFRPAFGRFAALVFLCLMAPNVSSLRFFTEARMYGWALFFAGILMIISALIGFYDAFAEHDGAGDITGYIIIAVGSLLAGLVYFGFGNSVRSGSITNKLDIVSRMVLTVAICTIINAFFSLIGQVLIEVQDYGALGMDVVYIILGIILAWIANKIGDGKGDALFRLFQLVSQPESGAKSGK